MVTRNLEYSHGKSPREFSAKVGPQPVINGVRPPISKVRSYNSIYH